MIKCLLFSIIAGVVGTGLGGIISIFFKKHLGIYPLALLFSGGFMLAVVCFELIPQALSYGSVATVTASYAVGIAIIMCGNYIFEKCFKNISQGSKKAFLIMLAIALHNFPEGLAIGGGEIGGFGLSIMLLMLIHNIPEGLTVALPLINDGKSKRKAIAYSALSGAPTVIGAFFGYTFSLTSSTFIAVFLSIAGGCMTYVTFMEIIPEGFAKMRNNFQIFYLLLGFSMGMLFCQIV